MSKDFIRYYISGIHFSMLETVKRESGKFNEWELSQGSDFNLKKSYGYKKDNFIPAHDEPLLKALAKRSVIAETRQPTSVKSSKLWNRASNIADILTLLSLARGRYYSAVIENSRGGTHGISWDLITGELEDNQDIVPISNLGGFVSEAFTYIGNPSWLEESGFTPSVYWFTQAQKSYFTHPSILEMGLYWISLEVLSRVYIVTRRIDVTHKKERVKRFIRDRGYSGNGWNFLGKAIDDWYIARNEAFHEGTDELPKDLLAKRLNQIRDFTSLVFVEMLQKQEKSIRNEIATRMQNY